MIDSTRKLIVTVTKLRDSGRAIPRYQHAFPKTFQGVITADEEHVPALKRRALVAILRDPETGSAIDGIAPLWDARVIRATADEWVWSGIEGAYVGTIEVVVAQTWRVLATSLDVKPSADGDGHKAT